MTTLDSCEMDLDYVIDRQSCSSPSTIASKEDTASSRAWSFSRSSVDGDLYPDPQKPSDPNDRSAYINTRRLWAAIHYTARWGARLGNLGMARLALTDEDKCVRDYFVSEACDLGCQVSVDEMGNIFAVLPGENNDIAPIGMGSHLDTQPAGGRFDGVLGVLGAIEIIRTLKSSGISTYAPLAAINWTNEEGARFTPGCSGSSVWASHIPLAKAYGLCDDNTECTMVDELRRIGYLGTVPADHVKNPLSAHFELHIEQGDRLEKANRKIGTVTSIQGIRWYEASIDGQRAHAGSTPMVDRSDALVAAAKMVTFVDEEAVRLGAVATVGVLDLDRPSLNTVPGTTKFTIDMRHPSEDVLDLFESTIQDHIRELTTDNDSLDYTLMKVWRSPAISMDKEAMSCVRTAAEKLVGDAGAMDIYSLAGHDSALIAMRVPTAMIFVPSKDGISHAPAEFTSEAECGTGVQVLLDAVLEYDTKLRASHKSQA